MHSLYTLFVHSSHIVCRQMRSIKLCRIGYACFNFRGRRLIHLSCLNMENAYLRRLDGAEDFQLSFHFKHEVFGISRQFNFSRQLSENVNGLVNRIQTNVDKSLSKYKRKLKKGEKREHKKEDIPEITVVLLHDGEPVPSESVCRDVLFGNRKLCLRVFTTDYTIVINAPWVSTITLPASIMIGFPVYPSKFESVFTVKNDSIFTWHRGMLDKNEATWIEVGNGYYYTPTVNDLGYNLKVTCIPGNGDIHGPPVDAISKDCIEAGPGPCPFEVRHSFTAERISCPSFRVVSYNILADLYADSDVARTQLFPYCPPYALGIDYRKQLILKEILGYHGDIVCLQEVDSKVFYGDLEPVLSYDEYEGKFEKKGGQVNEGLACFFHKSKFRLLKSHYICLADELKVRPIFSELWEKIKTNEPLVTRFIGRATCVHVVVLECISDPSRVLVVGNTHLYFHPDADHIRLLQAGMAILYLQDIINTLSSQFPEKQFSTLMCGDFNSTPECGVYQLMTTQFVPADYQDWNSNVVEAVKDVSLSHTLPLESAYGTPEFTNFTEGFSGCLDYIFYQRDTLSVSQVIPLPSEEEMRLHVALPNVVFPSDHVALVADITWAAK